jgi:hypothetical protein
MIVSSLGLAHGVVQEVAQQTFGNGIRAEVLADNSVFRMKRSLDPATGVAPILLVE